MLRRLVSPVAAALALLALLAGMPADLCPTVAFGSGTLDEREESEEEEERDEGKASRSGLRKLSAPPAGLSPHQPRPRSWRYPDHVSSILRPHPPSFHPPSPPRSLPRHC